MEQLDPLLLGDIPDDLPLDLFDEDFMDSYCNELAYTATDTPDDTHAGRLCFSFSKYVLHWQFALSTGLSLLKSLCRGLRSSSNA